MGFEGYASEAADGLTKWAKEEARAALVAVGEAVRGINLLQPVTRAEFQGALDEGGEMPRFTYALRVDFESGEVYAHEGGLEDGPVMDACVEADFAARALGDRAFIERGEGGFTFTRAPDGSFPYRET